MYVVWYELNIESDASLMTFFILFRPFVFYHTHFVNDLHRINDWQRQKIVFAFVSKSTILCELNCCTLVYMMLLFLLLSLMLLLSLFSPPFFVFDSVSLLLGYCDFVSFKFILPINQYKQLIWNNCIRIEI